MIRGPEAPVRDRADAWAVEFLAATAASIDERYGPVAGVAIATVGSSRPRACAASTDLAGDVDRLQLASGDGPGRAASRTGRAVYVADLAADRRWGGYGPGAAACGAASSLSVPLRVHDEIVAVFEVYSSDRDGLSDAQRALGDAIARELSGGMFLVARLGRQASELDDMTALMAHRRSIDLALGILMERAQVTADVAFELLRTRSQQRNVKLHEIARGVVTSLPGASPADVVPHFNPHG